jgi:CheY-like chemotaxis protein
VHKPSSESALVLPEGGIRILVVEDNEINKKLMQRFLNVPGISVVEVTIETEHHAQLCNVTELQLNRSILFLW